MHFLLFVKTHLQNKFLEQRLLDQRINAYLILLDTAWIPTTMIVEIGYFDKLSKWLLCSIKFKNHSFRKRIFAILSINYLLKKCTCMNTCSLAYLPVCPVLYNFLIILVKNSWSRSILQLSKYLFCELSEDSQFTSPALFGLCSLNLCSILYFCLKLTETFG